MLAAVIGILCLVVFSLHRAHERQTALQPTQDPPASAVTPRSPNAALSPMEHGPHHGGEHADTTVRCVVLDATTRTALPGSEVTASYPKASAVYSLQADKSGAFSLPGEGVPGSLVVKRDGYFTTIFTFSEGAEPEAVPLTILLLRKGVFFGRVVDAETGAPIRDANARFEKAASVAATATSDDRGDFELGLDGIEVDMQKRVTPEDALDRTGFTLVVEAPGYFPYFSPSALSWIKAAEVNTGKDRVRIPLEPELSIDGLVVSPDGNPVADAAVMWSWQVVRGLAQSSRPGTKTWTRVDGTFVWRGPQPVRGSLILAWHHDLGYGWAYMARPGERQVAPLIVRLSPKSTLRGRVLDENGAGIGGVRIALEPRDLAESWRYLSQPILYEMFGPTRPWLGRTAGDGTFTLDGLSSGSYKIRLTHPVCVTLPGQVLDVVVAEEASWEGRMVRGRVVRGVVLSNDGHEIPEARVRFSAETEVVRTGVMGRDVTERGWAPVPAAIEYDGRGGFVAEGLPLEPLRVQGRAPGHPPAEESLVPVEESWTVVTLADSPQRESPSEEETCAVDLVCRCDGTLVDLPAMYVSFFLPGTSQRFRQTIVMVRHGRAHIADAPRGTFDVVAAPFEFQVVTLRNVILPSAEAFDMSFEPALPVKMWVNAPAHIRLVRVLNDEGRPIQQAMVEEDNSCYVVGLSPGLYAIRGEGVAKEEYESLRPVLLSSDTDVTVHLEKQIR